MKLRCRLAARVFSLSSLAILALLTMWLLLLSPSVASACDCMPPPPIEKALADARIVAVARVTKVESKTIHTGSSISSGPTHIQLTITRAWKGAKPGDVVNIVRGAGRSTCDYDLEENTTHLLYLDPLSAQADGGVDARAPHCARSRAIDKADEEIRALDKLVPLPSTSSASPPPPAPTPTPPSAPAVEPKSASCAGCAVIGTSPDGAAFVALAVALLALRRRRPSSCPTR